MWSYTVVQYAILNEKWIKENGDHWAAGRIECWKYNEDTEGWEGYPLYEIFFVVHVDDYQDFVYDIQRMRTEELIDLKTLNFRFHTHS